MPGEFSQPSPGVPFESPAQPPGEVPLHPQEQVKAWCDQLDHIFEKFPRDGKSYPVVQEIQYTLRGWVKGLQGHAFDGLENAIDYAAKRLPERQGRFTCFDTIDQLDAGLDRRLDDIPSFDTFCKWTAWTLEVSLDPYDGNSKPRMSSNEKKRLKSCYDEQYQAAQSAYQSDVEPITPEMVAATQDEARHAEVCDVVQTKIMAEHAPDVQRYIDLLSEFKSHGRLDPNKDADLDARFAGYLRKHSLRIILDARAASYQTPIRKMIMEAWVQTGVLPTEADVYDRVQAAFTRHMVEDFAADLAVRVRQWKAAKDDREARIRQAKQDRQDEQARAAAGEQARKEAAAFATQRIENRHYPPQVIIGVAELIGLASQPYINPMAYMEKIRDRVAELIDPTDVGHDMPYRYLEDLCNAGLLRRVIENSQRS